VKQILLVTEPTEAPGLCAILRGINPDVQVDVVSTLNDLEAATINPAADLRVITFLTGVIVPAEILQRLPGPAYNFHPGPPNIRGLFPAVYALYEGHDTFGVTAHEVAPEIDSGPIVAVLRTEISLHIDRLALETMSRDLLTDLFTTLAPGLMMIEAPLAACDEMWSGTRHTRTDFEALCTMPHDVDDAEFRRRYRAIHEGPDHALKLTRFGRTFSMDPAPASGPVVKGGKAVD